ncbi:hypothetical protein H5410_035741 [Solanum commersonii]|uniref:Uncharacterized protein n=1 Tax=Solanum commersonii TaxID=4109 RepID=A0A9J5Y2Q9_SOLCO|nr:hypothetical protein H5410_035741 [Solanum commersonii]
MKRNLLCSVVDVSNGGTYLQIKERYEKITEQMLEHPFYCEDSCEWRLNISWNDTPDITQNERKLWAFDKPSIPQFAFMLSDIRYAPSFETSITLQNEFLLIYHLFF